MIKHYVTGIILLLMFIAWSESAAFRLIIKSDAELKYLKVSEHHSTDPIKLIVGINDVALDHYPNAVYLLKLKSSGNFKHLPMLWVPSETSILELYIDADYNVTFSEVSEYQAELNKIFEASNKYNLFPYQPDPSLPLEPILAMEAKSMIQNLKVYTTREVLENLLLLSDSRNISNWSTDALTKYLSEPTEKIYAANKLIKIFGLDSLQRSIEVTPDKEKYSLVMLSGSWCGPCVKGLPDLRKSHDELQEKVLFVTLWNDPNLKTFTHWHREKKQLITWPSLWDQYGLMANALHVSTYPTYILFDAAGIEISRWEGKFPDNLKGYVHTSKEDKRN